MKEANINYVRAYHYQHAQGFIELCDSIGMYVGEEISIGGAGGKMYDPSFIGSVMLRTQETVNRNIYRPSVIHWSMGYEAPFTYMHLLAVRTVNGIDGSRPCLLPWNASTTLPADIGILAPHYWTADGYDSLSRVADRPVITTVYVLAYGTQRFGGLADCWCALHDNPHGVGGAVWMWGDQGITTPTEWADRKYGRLSNGYRHLRVSSARWRWPAWSASPSTMTSTSSPPPTLTSATR